MLRGAGGTGVAKAHLVGIAKSVKLRDSGANPG